ncbi:MAG: hypothetical protein KBS51_06670 [Lachnospiraceae bacterium]|nr:hypothetical protein [Candidatus Darwinimomas equi]
MNQEKKRTIILSSILIVIIIAAQVMIFLTPEADVFLKTAAAVATVALISALVYSMTGFGKRSAKFFAIYMVMCALSELVELIRLIMDAVNTISVQPVLMIFTAAEIIALLILAFMKDVGKKVSFIIVTVIAIFNLLAAIVAIWTTASSGALIGIPVEVIRCGQKILLAAVSYLLVQYKYADKEARGSK